nr:MAG TPA: hypothetical protein [Caudoviricetes sp.]
MLLTGGCMSDGNPMCGAIANNFYLEPSLGYEYSGSHFNKI